MVRYEELDKERIKGMWVEVDGKGNVLSICREGDSVWGPYSGSEVKDISPYCKRLEVPNQLKDQPLDSKLANTASIAEADEITHRPGNLYYIQFMMKKAKMEATKEKGLVLLVTDTLDTVEADIIHRYHPDDNPEQLKNPEYLSVIDVFIKGFEEVLETARKWSNPVELLMCYPRLSVRCEQWKKYRDSIKEKSKW